MSQYCSASRRGAQALAPDEIRDAQQRAFDEKYRNELKLVASVQHVQNFPYDFYFGRKSDREEKEQKRSDQMIERAVRAHQRRAGQTDQQAAEGGLPPC